MAKIRRNAQADKIRNRVRIFRGVESILREESNQFHAVHVSNIRQRMLGQHKVEQKSLADQLRSWALEYHIKRRAVTSLLKILKFNGMGFLPQDSRTLLSTPRRIDIENRSSGKYWYNGIRNGLSPIFSMLTKNLKIDLNINIDGLPLFKSSALEFWPILANVRGEFDYKYNETVFINNLNEFISPSRHA